MLNKSNRPLLHPQEPDTLDTSVSLEFSELHPTWQKFIEYCESIQFGTLEKVQIQDGLPVLVEKATEKVKFSS